MEVQKLNYTTLQIYSICCFVRIWKSDRD